MLFNSCGKFIDATYDNRVDMNSMDNVDLLLANAYPERADIFSEILTDNFHHYGSTMQASMGPVFLPIYNWEDVHSEVITFGTPTYAYAHYYRKIYEANLALETLDLLTEDSDRKAALIGEALLLRAYSYFSLVNLFALHYNEKDNALNRGVPIITNVPKGNRTLYDRATVGEVYAQIDKDVEAGLKAFKRGEQFIPKTPYRFSLASVHAMVARMNLYKGKWAEAVHYSNLVLNERGAVVRRMSEDVARKAETTEKFWAQEIMNPSKHPNLLLVNQTPNFLCRSFGFRGSGFYLAHSLYYGVSRNDLRRHQFVSTATVIDSLGMVVKYGNQPNNPNAKQVRYDCFTIEEVLLNRAEANLRGQNPDITKAMTDIETIRKERFSPQNYKPLEQPTNVDGALELVWAERRLELLGQGFRWYDIKRLGIQVEHRLIRSDPSTANILAPHDKRTALQIPLRAQIGNPLLTNQLNPR